MLKKDQHTDSQGKYRIHSLYFDDLKNTCALATEAGEAERFKYRIRYYDEDTTFLRLERKEKKDGCGHKTSCLLTGEEYQALTAGDVSSFLYGDTQPLLQHFSVDILTRHFTPRLIVDYERVAFVEPITNVRITLDCNISVSRQLDRFLTGDYLREPLMRKEHHVLEVKFDDILPAYIKQCLYESNLQQCSFSKYALGFEKYRRHSS